MMKPNALFAAENLHKMAKEEKKPYNASDEA